MREKSISEIVFDRVKKGAEFVAEKGGELRDKAIKSSEKFARTHSLKLDVDNLQEKKQKKLKQLSYLVYNLYTRQEITHPEISALCQEIKGLQCQIDEKRIEVEMIKKEQGEYASSENDF
ncbi:MAG TPA: hypothetical protein PL110_02195 [Candidatus Eremiobacteraeota bacterium]|nr:MAG: hypothetical protein BWY64_03288 [bacterium ADurb.Bin363]HPZ06900.1 hypothetical protein [Candidatus Eremiobacteraeota bacterium]